MTCGNNQEANNIRVDIAEVVVSIKYMSNKYGGEIIWEKLYMWMNKSYIIKIIIWYCV